MAPPLVGSLVDRLNDAVCLSEPAALGQRGLLRECATAADYVKLALELVIHLREAILAGQPIADKRFADGTAPTNYFSSDAPTQWTIPTVFPDVGPRFLLGVKHNTAFTSVLPELAEQTDVPLLFVVRDPVATLLSWHARPQLPVHQGKLPAASFFWPELGRALQHATDVVEAQAIAYAAFARRYLRFAHRGTLVRYEEVVTRPDVVAAAAGRSFEEPVAPFDNLNANPLYDPAHAERVRLALRRVGGPIQELYPDAV